jgi:hypothetical protein
VNFSKAEDQFRSNFLSARHVDRGVFGLDLSFLQLLKIAFDGVGTETYAKH